MNTKSRFLRRFCTDTTYPIPPNLKREYDVRSMAITEGFRRICKAEGKVPVEIGEREVAAARFAVDEYNKRQNDDLSYERVVKAERLLVAGSKYYLIMEVKKKEREELKICKAEVWDRPWLKQKQLKVFEFKRPTAEAEAKVKPGYSCE
ncbi:hypothetical protein KI387_032771, partial [Taxus chinensis]